MRRHGSKLDNANVVAGFDSQADADEAVHALRSHGLSDSRIGYYTRGEPGQLIDLLARRHRFAGAILGGVIGLLLGAGLGWVLDQRGTHDASGIDPRGLAATLAIIGALALGAAGGMAGLWTDRPGALAPGDSADPFLIAVDAGDAQDRVRAILRQRGGHELHPREPAHAPAAHPA
jgi:hypothetical protein